MEIKTDDVKLVYNETFKDWLETSADQTTNELVRTAQQQLVD